MKDKLVIVESPTKARTITRFLGGDARILASMGHIRDLPENSLGVDVQHNFHPAYVLTRNGRRVLDELKKAAGSAKNIYLATDPDREGEAIAWHIEEVLKPFTKASFHRIAFHEITRAAILHAFSEPGAIDANRVDAQQARRVLDRIVGYQVSPMLWKSVRKGTSAGRVQSVALRLICERERAILSFVPVEFWNLDALFQPVTLPDTFPARLAQLDGKKPEIPNAEAANALAAELEKATFRVLAVNKTPKSQRAPPPFITSTLQQAASNALRMGAGQTMRVAQELYEGVEVGAEGPVGLITYMRTDAVDVAKEAQDAARTFIASTFGNEFVPEKPNVYRSRQTAQAAHEAIRPADVTRTPESLEAQLSAPQARLYRLIWNRFVASQMMPARMLEHSIEVGAEGAALTHAYIFRASATLPVFAGYLKVYDLRETELADKDKEEDNGAKAVSKLPEVEPGTACLLKELNRQQGFTEPKARYSEATLVRELEQNGIGRPSTYASIVETIQDREYVTKEKGRLLPTPLGFQVNDYLVETLPDLFQVGFTAEMEAQLDNVEEGNANWTAMIAEFYARFLKWSGGAGTVSAPTNARILAFLDCLPKELPWKEPVRRGTRTFDDKKFCASLCKQAEGTKPVSDKQWQAILVLAARYADHIPGLFEAAATFGVEDKLKALIEREKNPELVVVAESAKNLASDLQPLLGVLRDVTWEEPVKRGGRTFNDKRFYNSLAEQAEQGKGLSEAQAEALKRLALRYREQLPNFAELAAQFKIALPGAEATERQAGDTVRAAGLLLLLNYVQTWDAPKKRGARTFDDCKFADSIREQFEKRKVLSPRQVDALANVVRKYAKQIPGYEAKIPQLGLGPKPKPEPLSAKCPKCGAPLVQRHARGRTFYGCSTFPKCRHLTNTLPETAPA